MELREQVDVLPRLAAKIFVYGISPIACTATEISEKGATLIVVGQLGIPDTFELSIAGAEKRHRCVVANKGSAQDSESFLSDTRAITPSNITSQCVKLLFNFRVGSSSTFRTSVSNFRSAPDSRRIAVSQQTTSGPLPDIWSASWRTVK